MLSNGLLVLMPVIALILMADLALAIAGRMHAQLQMMALAFPIKMLLGLGLLAWLATLLPLVYRRWTADLVAQLRTLLT
jgi:flagellar biosynthetic protein FliR